MRFEQGAFRSPVRHDQAEKYILISLIAFAVTVIVTSTFLQLTGFPQIGNSVLHIAHALWGGLLLLVAAYLPLAYANRWVIQASALLGGIGIGLFIDEVGKFITQANDYFFPTALLFVYGFILLNALVYLYFCRQSKESPRQAMYHVFKGLQDVLEGDLDSAEAGKLEAQLAIARQSDRAEIVSLANALSDFLEKENEHLIPAKLDFWKRLTMWIDAAGHHLGRSRHRAVISVLLIGWVFFVAGYITIIIQGEVNLDSQVLQWRIPQIVIQIVVGILLLFATLLWLRKRESLGLKFGISAFLISLVALQLIYFYISQFLAITATLLQ